MGLYTFSAGFISIGARVSWVVFWTSLIDYFILTFPGRVVESPTIAALSQMVINRFDAIKKFDLSREFSSKYCYEDSFCKLYACRRSAGETCEFFSFNIIGGLNLEVKVRQGYGYINIV